MDQFDPVEFPHTGIATGLGSFLIKRLMDQLEYCSLGNQGKITRMVKYFRVREEFNGEAAPEAFPPAPEPEPSLPFIDFEIRRLMPEDAFKVSDLSYDTCGYSYLYKHICFL